MTFEAVKSGAEFLSFVAVIVGVPLALLQMRDSAKKEQKERRDEREAKRQAARELGERAYREVDERFMDYIKLCIVHPRLDGYSVPRQDAVTLTEDEKAQQRILYTALTDVFEVAYVQYHRPGEKSTEYQDRVKAEWPGWEGYMRKFLGRPAYARTWQEIEDEYEAGFRDCMNRLAKAAAPPAAKVRDS